MTTTTKVARRGIGPRTATPDEAVTSVVGYLMRTGRQLAADHVTGNFTPRDLRQLADYLHIMGGRLLNAADAIESGAARMPISDTTTLKGTSS